MAGSYCGLVGKMHSERSLSRFAYLEILQISATSFSYSALVLLHVPTSGYLGACTVVLGPTSTPVMQHSSCSLATCRSSTVPVLDVVFTSSTAVCMQYRSTLSLLVQIHVGPSNNSILQL